MLKCHFSGGKITTKYRRDEAPRNRLDIIPARIRHCEVLLKVVTRRTKFSYSWVITSYAQYSWWASCYLLPVLVRRRSVTCTRRVQIYCSHTIQKVSMLTLQIVSNSSTRARSNSACPSWGSKVTWRNSYKFHIYNKDNLTHARYRYAILGCTPSADKAELRVIPDLVILVNPSTANWWIIIFFGIWKSFPCLRWHCGRVGSCEVQSDIECLVLLTHRHFWRDRIIQQNRNISSTDWQWNKGCFICLKNKCIYIYIEQVLWMNHIALKVYFYFDCDMNPVSVAIERFLSWKYSDRLRNTQVTWDWIL